ncbi:MAG: hypothetical protein KVP17_003309 [Porospora cf. gigantea B]|uniref:uncharacterized protein n=1 Tax=Porospora cf. gigantea B TaxID=2853592 RepID=UPI0035719F78|nr:MAG: hypothetical protein KVP17_003309 [Porospora cf. gigantea B]
MRVFSVFLLAAAVAKLPQFRTTHFDLEAWLKPELEAKYGAMERAKANSTHEAKTKPQEAKTTKAIPQDAKGRASERLNHKKAKTAKPEPQDAVTTKSKPQDTKVNPSESHTGKMKLRQSATAE